MVGIASAAYFFNRYQDIKDNPDVVAQEETERLVQEVGQLIDLPQDEMPTIATVLDREKLQDQPFFANLHADPKSYPIPSGHWTDH